MIGFLKKLFGSAPPPPPPPPPAKAKKPPLPADKLAEFTTWFEAQTKPAIALEPDASLPIAATGSRLGGPAWLAEGENWPVDHTGVPLEFLAQLDMADCTALEGYPASGVIQFFIGRDDLFGMEMDDLKGGKRLVRMVDPSGPGALHAPPPLEPQDEAPFSDYSPFYRAGDRANGMGLRPEAFTDRIDPSIHEADQRISAFWPDYDLDALYDYLEDERLIRRGGHHTGGFPAYTQADVRGQPTYEGFDHVLLRVSSDDSIMWGDVGEAVFLIRSEDLARGDLSNVVYSWDCS